MDREAFLAFYPQFGALAPAVVLDAYVAQAGSRFSGFSEADAEEARRLFVAHKLTLYAMTLPASASPSVGELSAAGRAVSREVASKKVGEVSVSYAEERSLSSSVSASLADLPETAYGRQLLSLLRMYGRSRYVP